MDSTSRKRLFVVTLCFLALFVTSWLELFLQRKQNIIGGGINRAFLFLFINVHVIVIVILLFIIIRKSIKLFIERRKELPGTVFKRNLLFAFTFFSVIPSFFVFFTAGKLITTSIDDWFHVRISNGLSSAINLHEAQTSKQRKALLLAGEQVVRNLSNSPQTAEYFCPQFALRQAQGERDHNLDNLTYYLWTDQGEQIHGSLNNEIQIWRSYRRFNDRSMQSLKQHFFNHLKNNLYDQAIIFDFYGSLYWAKRIHNMLCILVHRYPENIRYPLIEIQNSYDDYAQLKSMRNPIYLSYIFTFILVMLLILFLSIWCAFYLAKGISAPIQELLQATERVRNGARDVQVKYKPTSDLKALAVGFNEMTKALNQAHTELERKNTEMLMILENIKASVFFVNKFGRIITFNRAAQEMVAQYLNLTRFKNKKIHFFGKQVKERFFSLARELASSDKNYLSQEITFSFKSESRILMVHMTAISTSNSLHRFDKGLLIVVEDLTDIVKINKMKTWQEAAKQMAHEIKNPLTPIQLATQRLQRKYRETLREEPTFIDSTNTILNQVKIIKHLASHFSEFASMPSSIIEPTDLNAIINEIIRLYELSYPDIIISSSLHNSIPTIKTDKKKIKQVLINLLDNSIRALLSFNTTHEKNKKCITIGSSLITHLNQVEMVISDNGPGIEKSVKDTLFLPYVSTNKKNMGLGLAIVHDIITQLGGSIKLIPNNQGATFQIRLPI